MLDSFWFFWFLLIPWWMTGVYRWKLASKPRGSLRCWAHALQHRNGTMVPFSWISSARNVWKVSDETTQLVAPIYCIYNHIHIWICHNITCGWKRDGSHGLAAFFFWIVTSLDTRWYLNAFKMRKVTVHLFDTVQPDCLSEHDDIRFPRVIIPAAWQEMCWPMLLLAAWLSLLSQESMMSFLNCWTKLKRRVCRVFAVRVCTDRAKRPMLAML